MNLSEQEKRILSNQIALPNIGDEGQQKIKESKVLVIGAGGKGTAALQQLAKAGVGTVGISDNYPIEESELPRQSIYGCKDLGKLRAIAVKEKLDPINRFVQFNIHNICLSETNIDKIIEPYDFIVDATDNFPSRYLINDACIKLNKPFVFGSFFQNTGMVTVFNFASGPSLRCLYPEVPNTEDKPSQDNIFSMGIPLGILGNLMANEVLKVILGNSSALSGKLMKFNFADYSISFEAIKKVEANFRF